MSEKFINLSYKNIELLFRKSEINSALGCKKDDVITDECGNKKIRTSFGDYDYFDIDAFISKSGFEIKESSVRTAIILKNKTLITSAICKVEDHEWSDFSLFSEFYSKSFERFGYVACSFQSKKIQYLLDINKFLEFVK